MASALAIVEEVEGRDVAPNAHQDVFDRAMQRFVYTVEPQVQARAIALQARRFVYIVGSQWEDQWGELFENSIRLEIDKVKRGVDKIRRDYRSNRIVPDFRPKGTGSDQDTADTLDGLWRADANHFKAQQALDNAFEEGCGGGMGALRITTAWADPLDKDSDEQRINPAMIICDADQRVFFDPNSKLYDKSDAMFCYVLTADQRQSFEEEHPNCLASWPDGMVKPFFDWYTPDVVIKCEYYEVEEKDAKLLIFRHVLTNDEMRYWQSEVTTEDREELEAQGYVVTTQKRKRRRVHKWLMSGAEVLKDYGYIAGDQIPVVPFYYDRAYVDNQERFEGYVARRMDRQRIYNGMMSRLMEINSLAPREKPIFLAEQMPPHLQELWANQEHERHPYALVNGVFGPDGQPIALGPIGMIQAPQVEPVTAALLQAANADLQEDMQDPDEVASNVSAEAMDIAATRVDAKSGIPLDNFAQTVRRAGEVYLAQCRDIYWQKGRKVETQSEDGDDGEATLQEAYTDKSGKHGVRNDFTTGAYKVIVEVTEATATRQDKTVKSMMKLAEIAGAMGNQALGNVALLTAVMNQDGEGMGDLQGWARKQLIAEGVVQPNEEEQAEMEEAQQQQQPDPTAIALLAQAKDSEASAGLKEAQTGKAAADTKLSEAKTIETLASAKSKGADAEATMIDAHTGAEDAATRRIAAHTGVHDSHTRRHTAMQPANDEQPRQKIRRGF